jgi:hypothetical protein
VAGRIRSIENYKYENNFKLYSFKVKKDSCEAFVNKGKLVKKICIAPYIPNLSIDKRQALCFLIQSISLPGSQKI